MGMTQMSISRGQSLEIVRPRGNVGHLVGELYVLY